MSLFDALTQRLAAAVRPRTSTRTHPRDGSATEAMPVDVVLRHHQALRLPARFPWVRNRPCAVDPSPASPHARQRHRRTLCAAAAAACAAQAMNLLAHAPASNVVLLGVGECLRTYPVDPVTGALGDSVAEIVVAGVRTRHCTPGGRSDWTVLLTV